MYFFLCVLCAVLCASCCAVCCAVLVSKHPCACAHTNTASSIKSRSDFIVINGLESVFLILSQGGWLPKVTAAWQSGRVSNFDYLLYINLAAGVMHCFFGMHVSIKSKGEG